MRMEHCTNFKRVKKQILDEFGKFPKKVKLLNCVGAARQRMDYGVSSWILVKNNLILSE